MKRLSAFVLASSLAVVLSAVVTESSPGPGSGAGHAREEALSAQARAAFVKYMSSHAPLIRAQAPPGGGGTVVHSQPMAANAASNGVEPMPSVNWSGYTDVVSGSDGTVTSVTGHWVIPSVTCPPGLYRNQDAFAAQWVGVDGVTDQTVEQLGTGEQCYEGQLYYYVWYEMYPQEMVEEGPADCINSNVDCVRPGDQVSASVTITPGTAPSAASQAGAAGTPRVNDYTLALTDSTTPGSNFAVEATCPVETCLDQSAEWVVERPATLLPLGAQILPLVSFSQDTFTNGAVVSGGRATSIGGFQGGPIYDVSMLDDTLSYYLDCVGQPTPAGRLLLSSDAGACPMVPPVHGDGFSVSWDSSF